MKPVKRSRVVIKRLRTRARRYFSETSLHGFRYITDPDSSKFKSYFWTVVCIINTCLCFILIRSQFNAYYSNRITTTILTTAFPIWEVPFPSVTICNFNLVYKDKVQKFKNILANKTTPRAIDNFFTNLSSLVLSNKIDKDIKWTDHYPVSRLLERAGYNTEELMLELMHPCEQMVTDCYWNNQEKNCSELFKVTKTTSGFCCAFNNREKKSDKEELYVQGVGPSYGLYIHLNVEEDQYLSPTKHSSGIDVAIHENIQYPDMSVLSTTIRPGNDISFSIKPEITQSEGTVQEIDLKTRGCAFANEIKMEWTHSYSYATCVNRCKAKVIKTLCRCIPYYYYPIKGRSRYCTLSDLACIVRNNGKLKNSNKASFSDFSLTSLYKSSADTDKCQCYPQCNEISYSYQVDQEPIKISETETRANDSILRVYFGHVSCTKLQKNVLITWELILASVGGLIGLCLGGSILSIIEFFYHIVEALFSRYGKQKNQVIKFEKSKYKPQLYLSDFKNIPTGKLFEISNGKYQEKTNEFK